ncbi:unnamed protein product [Kuraishia capsulata CBS 1993]|uniref:C2H2-type domain-containing protein n=1 Tax=Kuraishia capsulata CBS 1993 TaxID=1382522 RepID=W6MJV1_9ASCO|nr:uncharacterized protein KUCA_T00000779001 [Kuraishia capsulata CBS 1993]CDK24812.1 unnamed protein product [Kuraishia capsulata CBS 1993]
MSEVSAKPVAVRFYCDFAGCARSFTRQDHLNRHKKNHSAELEHKCDWPGCNKFFTRSDVREKHYKRHEVKSGIDPSHNQRAHRKTQKRHQIRFISVDANSIAEGKRPASDAPDGSASKRRNLEVTQFNSTPILNEPVVSSEDLLQWLLQDFDSLPVSQDMDAFADVSRFQSSISVGDQLEVPCEPPQEQDLDFLQISSQFPYSTDQTTINSTIMEDLAEALPSIKYQEEFRQERLEYYLEMYWTCFHSQFPVLNKPSFSTFEAHPILLLSMIVVGASMSNSYQKAHLAKPLLFADSIAVPLRWLIYKNKEFKPPPKSWIVQSLTMLELYEISSSSRDLHERANLHHGLTIQMLRRSPMFGGDPWMKYNYATDNQSVITVNRSSDTATWKKWIEQESMKRTSLFAFYLETVHAIVFGHEMMLALHDVKLSLPCDENLWQYGSWGFNTEYEIPLKFLGAIKKVIHRQVVVAGAFGKQMILSGLLSLFFQLEEKDFELSISDWNSRKEKWKGTIILAINFWNSDICPGGCCNIRNSVCSELLPLSPQSFQKEDFTCKSPLRHLYASYTDLKHYDFMVYAGAPGRMNVKFSGKDTEAVNDRVQSWCEKGGNALVTVIQIYLFLCEMMLGTVPESNGTNEIDPEEVPYDPSTDCFPYRKHMLTHMLIILWCYNFYISGPESHAYSTDSPIDASEVPEKESAHAYLKRIKEELQNLTGLKLDSTISGQSARLFADSVPLVTHKHHMVGLLRAFKEKYEHDHSEIAREHSRLLDNCIKRSLGSQRVSCDYMFE